PAIRAGGSRRARSGHGRAAPAAAAVRGRGRRPRPRTHRRGPSRPRTSPPADGEPGGERRRRALRVATPRAVSPRGDDERQRHAPGERHRPGCAGRRVVASVRALLLPQAARHRARARHRQADGRCARRAHQRRRPPRRRDGLRRGPAAGERRRRMNGPPYDVGGAAAYALVATVWAIVAADSWRFRLASRPRNPLYPLLPPFTTAMVCFYGLYAFVALLLPPQWSERAPRWFELTDVALLASPPLFRALPGHAGLDAPPPSRAWLALTYGSAALLAATAVFPELVPLPTLEQQVAFHRILLPFYVVGVLGFGLRDVRRSVRPGRWRGAAAVARGADVMVVAMADAGVC